MTEQNYDDAIAELGRPDGMDSETVAALERRLLQAFTEHHAGSAAIRARGDGWGSWRRWGAAAAAVVLLVAGVSAWWAIRVTAPAGEAPGPDIASAPPAIGKVAEIVRPDLPAIPPKPPRRPRPARPIARPAEFVALPGAAGLPAFESGTIVRLELSLASLPSYGVDITRAGAASPVEADVLVGQDGQPRAIRLVSRDNARSSRSQQ
jgi:hypothetical protein